MSKSELSEFKPNIDADFLNELLEDVVGASVDYGYAVKNFINATDIELAYKVMEHRIGKLTIAIDLLFKGN